MAVHGMTQHSLIEACDTTADAASILVTQKGQTLHSCSMTADLLKAVHRIDSPSALMPHCSDVGAHDSHAPADPWVPGVGVGVIHHLHAPSACVHDVPIHVHDVHGREHGRSLRLRRRHVVRPDVLLIADFASQMPKGTKSHAYTVHRVM